MADTERRGAIWFANLRLCLAGALAGRDYEQAIRDLAYFAPMCNRWVDSHRVAGSRRNRKAARKMLVVYSHTVADFSLLEKGSGGPLEALREIVRRLRKLPL